LIALFDFGKNLFLVLTLLAHMNSMLYNHVCYCLDVLRVYADGKTACLACSMDVRLDLHLVNLTFFSFFLVYAFAVLVRAIVQFLSDMVYVNAEMISPFQLNMLN
jgi:hypothetical protein